MVVYSPSPWHALATALAAWSAGNLEMKLMTAQVSSFQALAVIIIVSIGGDGIIVHTFASGVSSVIITGRGREQGEVGGLSDVVCYCCPQSWSTRGWLRQRVWPVLVVEGAGRGLLVILIITTSDGYNEHTFASGADSGVVVGRASSEYYNVAM